MQAMPLAATVVGVRPVVHIRITTAAFSCCPLDATLIQKQNPASPFRSDTCIAVLALLALHSRNQFPASGEVRLRALWYAGRHILLQAHILRI